MKRILITGAGGFIGQALAQSLAKRRYEVVAVDNNFRGSLDRIESDATIEKHEGDILDMDRMVAVSRGIDTVYHLAAINGTGNFYEMPHKVLEVGVIGTHNVLRACIENKVRHVVFASTSEVYQRPSIVPTPENIECKIPDVFNPRFSYAGGKIAGELMTIHYLNASGIRYTILRPHNVYGPAMGTEHVIPQLTQKIHREMTQSPKPTKVTVEIQGTGLETRSFIFISDAIRAIETCTLTEARSGIFHIGTEDEISIGELVRLMGRILHVEVETVSTPIREGSTTRRCPDTSKISALGFRPEVSLPDGLTKTVKWYEDYYNRTLH